MRKRHGAILIFLFTAVVAGCGGDNTGDKPSGPGATRPGLREGYQRFEAKPTMLGPGRSAMIVEWVGVPFDRDVDVVDVVGWQSKAGHHAILYATSDQQPLGTVRNWQNEDQITSHLIGGSGGEGEANVKLPVGVVTRIPKGFGLILQVHYLNASQDEVMGESFVDVKLADASPDHRVASFLTSTNLSIDVAAGQTTSLDVNCKLTADVPLLMFANHQHDMGVRASTEEIAPDGTRAEIKRDDRWQYEWAFNPNFTYRPVDSPLVLKAGNTLHTHCEWMNSTSRPVKFPDEMCVFLGFFLGDQDITCLDRGSN
jgi:hypothetical protein